MVMTQIQGRKPPGQIVVNGDVYNLKKDASDPTISFPAERMIWMNAGCDQIATKAHCCWIRGLIPPSQGSLESPVTVFAIGFNECPVIMSPQYISKEDLGRMHFYAADQREFTRNFVNQFLGRVPEGKGQDRPAMTPWPVMDDVKEVKEESKSSFFDGGLSVQSQT